MNRRAYIHAFAVSSLSPIVGGCLSNRGSDKAPETRNPSSEYGVEQLSDNQSTRPVEYSVSVVQPRLSDQDAPLALELKLSNRTTGEIGFGERRWALFHGVKNETDRYWLIPGTHPDVREKHGYEFDGKCWIENDQGSGLVGNGDIQIGQLDGEETITQPLLCILYTSASCPDLWPEELTFISKISVNEDGGSPWLKDDPDQYEWGFKLVRE